MWAPTEQLQLVKGIRFAFIDMDKSKPRNPTDLQQQGKAHPLHVLFTHHEHIKHHKFMDSSDED